MLYMATFKNIQKESYLNIVSRCCFFCTTFTRRKSITTRLQNFISFSFSSRKRTSLSIFFKQYIWTPINIFTTWRTFLYLTCSYYSMWQFRCFIQSFIISAFSKPKQNLCWLCKYINSLYHKWYFKVPIPFDNLKIS